MLLHVIDLAPFDPDADPVKDARAIVDELARYDAALLEKPRWLVLNKMDLIPEPERKKRVRAFAKAFGKRAGDPVFAVAAISGDGCRELVLALQDWLDAHPSPLAAGIEAEADTGHSP